jgi:hypothetical protein
VPEVKTPSRAIVSEYTSRMDVARKARSLRRVSLGTNHVIRVLVQWLQSYLAD